MNGHNQANGATNTGEVILRAERVSRFFGGLRALQDVDLEVQRQRLHAIIGPNGSGKSTLFNLITGHLPPTSGVITFHGHPISGLPEHKVAQMGIARSFQITTVFKDLTVFENLRVAAQARMAQLNFWRRAESLAEVNQRAEEALVRVGLQDKRHARAAELSHGEQRHLDIGIALACSPELLLLDEPTAGMSPFETAATMELIREIGKSVTVLLVEHKMDVVLGISDWITVLNLGRVLVEGTPREIQRHPEVIEAYLGKAIDISGADEETQ